MGLESLRKNLSLHTFLIPIAAGNSLSAMKEQKWPVSGMLGTSCLGSQVISHIPLGSWRILCVRCRNNLHSDRQRLESKITQKGSRLERGFKWEKYSNTQHINTHTHRHTGGRGSWCDSIVSYVNPLPWRHDSMHFKSKGIERNSAFAATDKSNNAAHKNKSRWDTSVSLGIKWHMAMTCFTFSKICKIFKINWFL